jgi:NAD(P)-dependent dehydrogenase (short-subunit alcohol dehydrogenase family)
MWKVFVQKNIPLKDLINLTGRCAIVTGGARGIGLAICHRLAEAGAKVLIADLNGDEAGKVSNELNSLGYETRSSKCDIAIEDDVKRMISEAIKTLGRINILVNNAGVYPRKPLHEMTGKDFEQVISVNLTGMFLCSRYAAQEMINKQLGGCVINIASIEAVHPSSTGMVAYDASKGGVLMLTKSMAHELGPHGIRVNAIAPGGIKTQGVLSQVGSHQSEANLKEFRSFISRIALDRMGDADDIARVALFLASDLSTYITGDLIVVDGGYLVS